MDIGWIRKEESGLGRRRVERVEESGGILKRVEGDEVEISLG